MIRRNFPKFEYEETKRKTRRRRHSKEQLVEKLIKGNLEFHHHSSFTQFPKIVSHAVINQSHVFRRSSTSFFHLVFAMMRREKKKDMEMKEEVEEEEEEEKKEFEEN